MESEIQMWDHCSQWYDENRLCDPIYISCVQVVADHIIGGGIVLDMGCGTGIVSEALSGRALRVVAIDHSFRSLQLNKEKCFSNVLLGAASAEKLPFKDNAFDAVVCANMLQHVGADRHGHVMRELYRVLKPGGEMVVSVHHYSTRMRDAGYSKEGVWVKAGDPASDKFYVYRFEKVEIEALLPGCTVQSAGYYEVSGFGVLSCPLVQSNISRMIGIPLADKGIGHMLVAHAKK